MRSVKHNCVFYFGQKNIEKTIMNVQNDIKRMCAHETVIKLLIKLKKHKFIDDSIIDYHCARLFQCFHHNWSNHYKKKEINLLLSEN
jgi:hypothetical protein